MADVTFTIGFKEDGTPVLRNIKREVESVGTAVDQAAKKASGGFQEMQRAAQDASGSTRGLASTLSSIGQTAGLFGVVASAATLVSLLTKAVTAGIQYNATLEQQRLGIASIVTATTTIADAQGKTLTGVEKFNAAQEISAALMRQIQQDALKTTATSEQLVAAFQSAIGPLSAAGLSLNQSRDATLRIVQAASAIGIPMEQVAQEVRAIAEGSIDVNARLAKTLDITNAQVASLKEQGKLYEFIVQKTEAFAVAGAKTEQSFSGLASSIADISAQILGLSTSTFFEELKSQMSGLLSVLTAVRNTLSGGGESGLEQQIKRVSEQLRDTQEHINWIRDNPLLFEGAEGDTVKRTTERVARLGQTLKELQVEWGLQQSAAGKAAGALDTYTTSVEQKATPAQVALAESMSKQLDTLKDQEAQTRLTARAFIDYQAAQLKGKGHTDEEIKQWRTYSLAILATKEAKEAATKATRDAADATRKSAADARKAAADQKKAMKEEVDIAEKVLDIRNDLRKEAEQRADANKTNLAQLNEEIEQLKEESQLLIAGLGPKAELLDLEKQIALARADRTTQTELLNAQEKQLNEENQKLIVTAGELRKKNIELAASNEKNAKSLRDALLTTNDLRDGFRDVIDSLADGDWSGALESIKQKGKELGIRLIEGFAFGKEGLENKVLIPNFQDLFGEGGSLQGILKNAGFDMGSIFGSSLGAGTSTGWQSAVGGFNGSGFSFGAGAAGSNGGDFNRLFSGIFSGADQAGTAAGTQAGTQAGSAASSAFGVAALIGVAVQAGKDFSKGKYGSGGGAIVGGAIAGYFSAGDPTITALGAMIGRFLGSFLDPLFKHIPTKGSLVRRAAKGYLKEIGVSFAKEIDSSEYFFPQTKKLADQMFGGDFLAASKKVLTDKAGPELAKQLQALGVAITSEEAIQQGKSVEQTGTTFGNMLVKNLGLEAIPSAIAEIVSKGDFTLGNLTERLTEVFSEGKISADFYTDTILGAVSIFHTDLPAAIDVAKIALKSFTDDGVFSLTTFEEKLQGATNTFNLVIQSFRDAIANSDTGTMAAELFGAQLKAGLEGLAIEAYLATFIDKELFKGVDLSDGLDSSEIALLTARTKEARIAVDALREGFAGAATNADALVARIRDLQSAIQEIANERIEIRMQLLDDLVSLELLDALDAIATRIEAIQERIDALIESAGQGHIGSRILSELSYVDLTQLIQLQAELRNAILARYREEAAAIQAAAQAQIAAIRAEYAARREAIQAAITHLQEQRTATQELFQAQIRALEEQLRVAEAFRGVVESINDMIRAAVQSPQSPLDPQQQQGFLQRDAAAIRAQLLGATGAERVRLMQELAQILQQQLSFVDRNTVNGQALFANIIRELTALRDAASVEADKAARLQEQIAAATLAMDLALKSIDAQIAAQQRLLADLSAQEAAAIAAVEATAKAQLEALRAETAQQLIDLARKTDEAKVEQLRRLEAQLETAREQLIAAVGAEEATKLLATGDQAHLVIQAQQLASLHSIDQHIIDAFNAFNPENNNAGPANNAGASHLLSGPRGTSSTAGGTSSGVTFSFSPIINVTVEPGEEERVKKDLDEIMRLAEQRFERKLSTDWAPRIRRIAEGGI